MIGRKTLLAAAALAALTAGGAGVAQAQAVRDFGHRAPAAAMRHDMHRPVVARLRVMETLRLHHYVGMGEPYFLHGRYVVRSHDRLGRIVLVQIDPWTGRFIGVVRI